GRASNQSGANRKRGGRPVGLWFSTMLASFCALTASTADGGAATAAPPAAVAAPSPSAEVKSLVDRMQSFYEKTQDFTANFKQDYTYKIAKRTQTSTGKVTFKKPGMMRWDYQTPAPKTFVLTGDRAYSYDPAAMLITKSAFDQSQLSAAVTFLFGT